jgi:hypothetical protein
MFLAAVDRGGAGPRAFVVRARRLISVMIAVDRRRSTMASDPTSTGLDRSVKA